jgi:lysophospholipase L1-like esterase
LGRFGSDNSNSLYADVAEVFLYKRALGAFDFNILHAYLNNLYALSLPTYLGTIALDGDSITCGAKGIPSWPQTLAAADSNYVTINHGVGAQNLVSMIADSEKVDASYQADLTNILVVFAGTNDIVFNGHTGALAYQHFANYCSARKAKGWKVVCVTMLPRAGAGEETQRQSFNNLIRANYLTIGDALADVETLPMGAANQHLSTTYFNADQIHPNNTGHAALATLIGGAVNSLK